MKASVNSASSSVWQQDPRSDTLGTPCLGGDCDYMLALKDWRAIIDTYKQVFYSVGYSQGAAPSYAQAGLSYMHLAVLGAAALAAAHGAPPRALDSTLHGRLLASAAAIPSHCALPFALPPWYYFCPRTCSPWYYCRFPSHPAALPPSRLFQVDLVVKITMQTAADSFELLYSDWKFDGNYNYKHNGGTCGANTCMGAGPQVRMQHPQQAVTQFAHVVLTYFFTVSPLISPVTTVATQRPTLQVCQDHTMRWPAVLEIDCRNLRMCLCNAVTCSSGLSRGEPTRP
jgi:hypothetical protein